MRLSQKQLQKFRSGQTVWRVLVRSEDGKTIQATVEREWFTGKKVLHHFSFGHSSIKFEWKAYQRLTKIYQDSFGTGVWPKPRVPDWMYGHPRFLAGSYGNACFTSKRQADRFCREVESFMHPDMTDIAMTHWEWDKMDRLFGKYDFFDEEYSPLMAED